MSLLLARLELNAITAHPSHQHLSLCVTPRLLYTSCSSFARLPFSLDCIDSWLPGTAGLAVSITICRAVLTYFSLKTKQDTPPVSIQLAEPCSVRCPAIRRFVCRKKPSACWSQSPPILVIMCAVEVLPPDVAIIAYRAANHGLQQFQTSMNSPSTSSEFVAFQKLLRQLYRDPNLSLQQVERLRAHLHRLFIVRSIDNTTFLVKCSPARDTRLLRHEYRSLETEGRVLDLVASKTHVPVPRRLNFEASNSNAIRSPYLLRSYIPGKTLASLSTYLSTSERADVDRSLGAYFHSLTQIKLRSFGFTNKVYAGQGSETWSQGFRTLLESVLRDAEDVLISLPYDQIRYWVAAHKNVLDEIVDAQMVPLTAGDPSKIILDERRKYVVGLLGFSNVVWGDPLLAGVFESASDAFWEGYGGEVDDTSGYRIRRLLYIVYRSVTSVAIQYHRPTLEGEDFEARRTLTWALGHLAGCRDKP